MSSDGPAVLARPASANANPDDTWLTVSGSLANRGGEFVLQGDGMIETKEPKDPYI